MKKEKIIIIGGVAAGPKTGARIKRLNQSAEVTLFERGTYISYSGCGLPYYVSEVVHSQDELMETPSGTVRNSAFFKKVKDINVKTNTEVIKISPEEKTVTVKNLTDNTTYTETYDKLMLATGASPIVPPFPGIDLGNIFTVSCIEDANKIKEAVKASKETVIIGGGLIGIEMAEALKEKGQNVTIVEKLPNILSFLDEDIALLVEKYLKSKGIKILTNTTVTELKGEENVSEVATDNGSISADTVILSIGVKPNTQLAKDAGLEIMPNGCIKVNDKMQTSNENIYAAGDCAIKYNIITKKPQYVPLGSTANKEGRVAANNICGIDDSFKGILGTAICKVFDYTIASTGLTQKTAIAEGFDVMTVLAPAPDKLHYYPTMKPIMMKLVFEVKTQRLLGSQIIGPGEVNKRIDVLATAISAKMTADDIAHLDLAYAPPYSGAIDNTLVAANIARNKMQKLYTAISQKEVKEKIDNKDDFIFLDVRSLPEYEMMHIDNSTLIPLGALREKAKTLPKDKEIVVFCKISLRGYEAARILQAQGFDNVKVMEGGILMWPYEVIM